MTMTIKCNELETAFIDAAVEIRERLSALDDPPNYMCLEISAEGRVQDGELKITFELHDGSYNNNKVRGGNLAHVVLEHERRFSWNRSNEPLCLPKVD